MAKKKSAQFKRFSEAMSKIVRVSKQELLRREAAERQVKERNKPETASPQSTKTT